MSTAPHEEINVFWWAKDELAANREPPEDGDPVVEIAHGRDDPAGFRIWTRR